MIEFDNIDISVVIPVYNAGDFIHTCLDSIIAQEGNCREDIGIKYNIKCLNKIFRHIFLSIDYILWV